MPEDMALLESISCGAVSKQLRAVRESAAEVAAARLSAASWAERPPMMQAPGELRREQAAATLERVLQAHGNDVEVLSRLIAGIRTSAAYQDRLDRVGIEEPPAAKAVRLPRVAARGKLF